jgi:nicotinate-nucleotide adenylyltransferase
MIGVLGGTFDPIHLGHLRPALDCLQLLALDQVRLIPLKVAVHRPQPAAPSALRLAMLEAAIADQPGLVTDPRELERPGDSYSHDTLVHLRAELGDAEPVCLLVGSDAFASFLGWYRPREILDLAHVVIMRRPGAPEGFAPDLQDLLRHRLCEDPTALRDSPSGRVLFQDVTQMDISSTRIRQLIRRGQSPRFLLPDAVLAICDREGLYR